MDGTDSQSGETKSIADGIEVVFCIFGSFILEVTDKIPIFVAD